MSAEVTFDGIAEVRIEDVINKNSGNEWVKMTLIDVKGLVVGYVSVFGPLTPSTTSATDFDPPAVLYKGKRIIGDTE